MMQSGLIKVTPKQDSRDFCLLVSSQTDVKGADPKQEATAAGLGTVSPASGSALAKHSAAADVRYLLQRLG